MTRSRERLEQLIQFLDVRNSFAFLPHVRVIDGEPTAQLTLCNVYASVFCAALGVRLPVTLKANKQVAWLQGPEGQAAGWRSVDRLMAVQWAALGHPVVAGWIHPMGGPGHIAMVVPSPHSDEVGAHVSAAGAVNIARGRLENSFGAVGPLHFFTHD